MPSPYDDRVRSSPHPLAPLGNVLGVLVVLFWVIAAAVTAGGWAHDKFSGDDSGQDCGTGFYRNQHDTCVQQVVIPNNTASCKAAGGEWTIPARSQDRPYCFHPSGS